MEHRQIHSTLFTTSTQCGLLIQPGPNLCPHGHLFIYLVILFSCEAKAAQCSGRSRHSTADSTPASTTGSASAEAGTRSPKQGLRKLTGEELQQRDRYLGAVCVFSAQNELHTHYQGIACSALRSTDFFYSFISFRFI